MTPANAPTAGETPLGHTLARVLARRWYAMLLPVLVVPAAAFYLSLRQPSTYESTAKVLVSRPELGSLLLDVSLPTEDPVRQAETQGELAGLRAVAADTTERLGLPPSRIGSIAAMIHVTPGRQSDILAVSARSGSAAESVRVANGAAASYTALHRQLETRSIDREHTRTVQALRGMPAESPVAIQLRAQLDRLAALQDLAADEAVVVERAVSAQRVAPLPVRTAEFGLGLGVILGLALAYLVEALDRRVRSLAELGSILRLPIVGELPLRRRLRGRRRVPTPVRSAPLGPDAEAFRFLEANVSLSLVGAECRSVLVTSASRHEGKTMTALNFALSAAETGRRVLLVELDFRHPRLAAELGRAAAMGIAEVVRGTATIGQVALELAVAPEPGTRGAKLLSVVVAGHEVTNPMQYLRSAAMRKVLREAGEQFDLVVLDVPPLFGFGDAMTASSLADGVLLVVDYRLARRPLLTDLLDVAEHLPSAVIGVVVNRAPRRPPSPPQAYWRRSDEKSRHIATAA